MAESQLLITSSKEREKVFSAEDLTERAFRELSERVKNEKIVFSTERVFPKLSERVKNKKRLSGENSDGIKWS